MHATRRGGFTLVEILIVVVILGILSAIVVPQFSNATQESKSTATLSQLTKLRNVLDVYALQNNNRFPQIEAGDGTWGELMSGGYLREEPFNHWVGGESARVISMGDAPDSEFTTDHGWIYRAPDAGVYAMIWAGSFDGEDRPFDQP